MVLILRSCGSPPHNQKYFKCKFNEHVNALHDDPVRKGSSTGGSFMKPLLSDLSCMRDSCSAAPTRARLPSPSLEAAIARFQRPKYVYQGSNEISFIRIQQGQLRYSLCSGRSCQSSTAVPDTWSSSSSPPSPSLRQPAGCVGFGGSGPKQPEYLPK